MPPVTPSDAPATPPTPPTPLARLPHVALRILDVELMSTRPSSEVALLNTPPPEVGEIKARKSVASEMLLFRRRPSDVILTSFLRPLWHRFNAALTLCEYVAGQTKKSKRFVSLISNSQTCFKIEKKNGDNSRPDELIDLRSSELQIIVNRQIIDSSEFWGPSPSPSGANTKPGLKLKE